MPEPDAFRDTLNGFMRSKHLPPKALAKRSAHGLRNELSERVVHGPPSPYS